MATVWYPAIIERAQDGYSVFFPDLPGCTSAGDTVQEAARGAEEALAGHIAVGAEYGDHFPEPSDVEQIKLDGQAVIALLVRADLPGKSVRLNITLDEGLVAAIDKVAKNRSGFLADAARDALTRR